MANTTTKARHRYELLTTVSIYRHVAFWRGPLINHDVSRTSYLRIYAIRLPDYNTGG
jgi:hypothetical protein